MPKLYRKTIRAGGQKRVVRHTRWFPPYVRVKTKSGKVVWKASLRYFTKANCGVYIIRSKRSREILYVGHSGTHLYKTMYRHFQKWNDHSQYRATYLSNTSYEVMVITTRSCDLAFDIEQFYGKKLKPRDGQAKFNPGTKLVSLPTPAELKKMKAVPEPPPMLRDDEVPF